MSLITDVLTAGTNNHQTTSETANSLATDILVDGVVGSLTNTAGVAPATGGFAVNAQGTPDMTVAVSAGVAYVTATPDSQGSQRLRVKNTASANVTISSNSTGGTRFDWIYIKIDPTKAANPDAAADDAATLVTSRSTSATTDNGTPPTYGYNIAVVTVTNGASSITNGNIADKRSTAGVSVAVASDGWITASETWTYASSTTFTITGDFSARYNVGDKIKLSQGSIKYFYITGVAASGGSTTVTVNGGSDYTLANATITNNSYSKAASPNGFPQWFNYTVTWTGFSTAPSAGITRFKLDGHTVTVNIRPTSLGTSNANTTTISLPIVAATISDANWDGLMLSVDNGVNLADPSGYVIGSAGTTADIHMSVNNRNWTTSGTKMVYGSMQYEI